MNIKNRQQILTIAAVAIVAIFALDKLVLTPLGHAWTDRNKRIKDLRDRVGNGYQLLKREDALRTRWDQMRTNTLPNNQSLAEQILLKDFDKWSKDSGLGLTSISSQWKHDDNDYMTLQYRIEAGGSLNAVTRFLYEMEKSPTALKLDNVEVSAHDNEGQQLTLGVQVSGLVLATQEQAQ